MYPGKVSISQYPPGNTPIALLSPTTQDPVNSVSKTRDTTCVFDGVDDDDLNAVWEILRGNYRKGLGSRKAASARLACTI